jgi:hypothetical protein
LSLALDSTLVMFQNALPASSGRRNSAASAWIESGNSIMLAPAKEMSSIERAEQLKRELTDKWVVVASGVPELRRFAELTGKVKTVNMNCRALVEFDGPEDIGWYDIDPAFLTVVDAPKPKAKAEADKKPAAKKAAPAGKAAAGAANPLDAIRASAGGAAAKPAAAAGGSPLDKIRASAAGGAAAKPAAGGSPMDQIRASAGDAAAKPAAGGSPMDQIRASAAAAPAAEPEAAAEEAPAAAEEQAPAEQKPAATPDPSLAGMSPLDQIRAMGAFKGDK